METRIGEGLGVGKTSRAAEMRRAKVLDVKSERHFVQRGRACSEGMLERLGPVVKGLDGHGKRSGLHPMGDVRLEQVQDWPAGGAMAVLQGQDPATLSPPPPPAPQSCCKLNPPPLSPQLLPGQGQV